MIESVKREICPRRHGGVDITALRKKVVQQKSKRDGGCYAPHTIDFKGLPIDVLSEHLGLFCKLQGLPSKTIKAICTTHIYFNGPSYHRYHRRTVYITALAVG
jgi:hypothetical protein